MCTAAVCARPRRVCCLSHSASLANKGKAEHVPRDTEGPCKHCKGGGIKQASSITVTKTRRSHHSFPLPVEGHAVHSSSSLSRQSHQVIPSSPAYPVTIALSANEQKRNSTLREGDFHQEVLSELLFSCTHS